MWRPLCVVIGILPGMVSAQQLIFDENVTYDCLNTGEDPRSCIGLSSQICMQATPGGHSTVAMGGCLDAELQWWDARLNAAYKDLRAAEKALDRELEASGASGPRRAPALLQMQRAWIPFRDAACAYEYSQWGGGTGGGPASVSCTLRLTAEQALTLERYLAEKP